jgi:hypothetical protein
LQSGRREQVANSLDIFIATALSENTGLMLELDSTDAQSMTSTFRVQFSGIISTVGDL